MYDRRPQNSMWSLFGAPSKDGTAPRRTYVNYGQSIIPATSLTVDFTASNGSLGASVRETYEDPNAIANLTAMGAAGLPSIFTLSGQTIGEGVGCNSYNPALSVEGSQSSTSSGTWAQGWF